MKGKGPLLIDLTDHFNCQSFSLLDRMWEINLYVERLEDVQQSGLGSDAHPVQVVQREPSDDPGKYINCFIQRLNYISKS